ncbi:MAG: hypothetical protein L3J42_03105 [Hydrogenimonas sp.]|nr:hypothetical protein [Hydrogenimonas sp.]
MGSHAFEIAAGIGVYEVAVFVSGSQFYQIAKLLFRYLFVTLYKKQIQISKEGALAKILFGSFEVILIVV